MKLYHPVAKLHSQIHVIHFWAYWRVLMSCFGPERHHKLMKKVCRNLCKTPYVGMTSLAYDINEWVRNLSIANVFMPTHLEGKEHRWDYEMRWTGVGAFNCTSRAYGMRTEVGLMRKGDILQFPANGVQVVGVALGFAATDSAQVPFVAFVCPCDPIVGSCMWTTQTSQITAIRADAIVGVVMYAESDGAIAPVMHMQ
jgi:hypothetical protein